jgi:glyoxylase-like metal-dependent hydrolase (beta-lactamase superfamily II)
LTDSPHPDNWTAQRQLVRLALIRYACPRRSHQQRSALAEATGANYYLHPYDAIHPFDMLPAQIPFDMLQDGQTFTLGDLSLQVIHTPGHTLGQVNFLAAGPDGESYLFTGDNLFLESFGRPDLGGQGALGAFGLPDDLQDD